MANKNTSHSNKVPHPITKDEVLAAQSVLKFFNQGGTFKDLQGINDQWVDGLYGMSYQLYQMGKYLEAENVFVMLCFYDHYERKHWLGLGACRQMQKKYKEASDAYAFAIILDSSIPDAHLHLAECALAMGNKELCKKELTIMIEVAKGPEHDALKTKAKGLLEILQTDKK